jgi:hypothetical protein
MTVPTIYAMITPALLYLATTVYLTILRVLGKNLCRKESIMGIRHCIARKHLLNNQDRQLLISSKYNKLRKVRTKISKATQKISIRSP